MAEEITDVKPPKGFPHITDLTGTEATILQVANAQGDILGYATMADIDAYIESKVAQTIHSFTAKQTFQDVTINGTFDGNNVYNKQSVNNLLNSALEGKENVQKVYSAWANNVQTDINVNGADYGKTVLIMLCGHFGGGRMTYSEVGMLWCGFNGAQCVYKPISTDGYKSDGAHITSSLTTISLVNSNVKFTISGIATIKVKAIVLD